jgi:hypothetical protein
MRKVLYCTHWIKHDLDQDGRAELLRVQTIGRTCEPLDDPEPCSDIPLANFVIDPTPHSAISPTSLHTQIADLQRAKSQLMRDVFDNISFGQPAPHGRR